MLPTVLEQGRPAKQFVPEQVPNMIAIHKVAVVPVVRLPFLPTSIGMARRAKQFVPEQVPNFMIEKVASGPSPLSIELAAIATSLQQTASSLQAISKTV